MWYQPSSSFVCLFVCLLVCLFQAEGETAVLVAGDPEREHMRKVREDGGIYYHENVLKSMVSVEDYKFRRLWKIEYSGGGGTPI